MDMNAKISVFPIGVETIIHLLLYNLHGSTFFLLIVYLLFKCVHSSHFRGATISWKRSDKEGEVNVKVQKQLFSFAPKNSCSEISKICPTYNILHLFSVVPAIFLSFQMCI